MADPARPEIGTRRRVLASSGLVNPVGLPRRSRQAALPPASLGMPFCMTRETRPTLAEIDLKAIGYNLQGIRRKVGPAVRVMGVVKGNAYGHGILEVSKFLKKESIDYLGVANPEEGSLLRAAGVDVPIHVFTLPAASQVDLYGSFDLEATVCTEYEARLLNSSAQREGRVVPVHLKIDTGMNRIGIAPKRLNSLLGVLARLRNLEIKGVFTHLAAADQRDKGFSRQQIEIFSDALDFLRRQGLAPELIHCAGSAGILDLPESYFSMVRPGIMMYGCYPSAKTSRSVSLKPVLTLRSRISLVKWIEAGEGVGYGRHFIAKRRTKIATLPVGYADGYARALMGRSSVLIGGQRFQTAGAICMDQLMVDVGDHDFRAGDDVVLIGQQGRAKITACELASWAGTIPYEICSGISSRVPRVFR
jgi:alanine racemase